MLFVNIANHLLEKNSSLIFSGIFIKLWYDGMFGATHTCYKIS